MGWFDKACNALYDAGGAVNKYAQEEYDKKAKRLNKKITNNNRASGNSGSTAVQTKIKPISRTGGDTLEGTANPKINSNASGVYLLYLNGDVKKAGSAKIGIQKRMQQYYGLNSACGINHHINTENRSSVIVRWQTCEPEHCDELESKLNDKFAGSNSMAWTERRPHSSSNEVELKL